MPCSAAATMPSSDITTTLAQAPSCTAAPMSASRNEAEPWTPMTVPREVVLRQKVGDARVHGQISDRLPGGEVVDPADTPAHLADDSMPSDALNCRDECLSPRSLRPETRHVLCPGRCLTVVSPMFDMIDVGSLIA
jgi:hypothetical protein